MIIERDVEYIEDQTFGAKDSLFPAIVEACRRGVKVVAIVPAFLDPSEGTGRVNQELTPAAKDHILAKLPPQQQRNLAVWRHERLCACHADARRRRVQLHRLGELQDRSMQPAVDARIFVGPA